MAPGHKENKTRRKNGRIRKRRLPVRPAIVLLIQLVVLVRVILDKLV